LFTDDYLKQDNVVQEALKRLPKDVFQERQFRLTRSLLVSSKKDVLPKEEWTTFENDLQYLTPYVEQVRSELREVDDWENERVDI
jgi:ubiquinol-cytochrome c reductase subunit 7